MREKASGVPAKPQVAGVPPSIAVRRGVKLILRLARRMRLAPGDKFPPQSELRAQLELTNFVISGAMEELARAQAIVRKGKGGTTFLGLDSFSPAAFTVAVAAISPAREPVTPSAAQAFTQTMFELFERGCTIKTCFRSTVREWTPPTTEEFNGLKDDIDNGEVDAVLLPLLFMRAGDQDEISARGTPVVSCGVRDDTTSGVLIDQRAFAAEAVGHLASTGCRHLAVANLDNPKPGYSDFWRGFQEGLAIHGLPLEEKAHFASLLVTGRPGGQRIAQDILALPSPSRPDGVVFTDDWLALGFCETVATT